MFVDFDLLDTIIYTDSLNIALNESSFAVPFDKARFTDFRVANRSYFEDHSILRGCPRIITRVKRKITLSRLRCWFLSSLRLRCRSFWLILSFGFLFFLLFVLVDSIDEVCLFIAVITSDTKTVQYIFQFLYFQSAGIFWNFNSSSRLLRLSSLSRT